MRTILLALALAGAFFITAAPSGDSSVWRMRGHDISPAEGSETPAPVGSLQKLWVLRAWAEEHPEDTPLPVHVCAGGASCWFPAGHGRLSLRRAVSVSCNSYFRSLAGAAGEKALTRVLESAGFLLVEPVTPDSAIGLGSFERLARISPGNVLKGYRELMTTPWPQRDGARLEWLSGMADSAISGTGKGILRKGWLVKTGTVLMRPDFPAGWALLADPAWEEVLLARMEGATGAETASELGRALGPSPGVHAPGRVRVRLFSSLSPERIVATNLSKEPVPLERAGSRLWIGGGSHAVLKPGDELGEARWELLAEPYHLRRIVFGTLEGHERSSAIQVVLETPVRSYEEGVLRAELRQGSRERSIELAAAVLRFLTRGKRHGNETVCDLSHCAAFAGYGPDVTWITRTKPAENEETDPGDRLDDAAWDEARDRAARPGPSTFSAHCGGQPLSEWQVWGRGSRAVWACPRHPSKNSSFEWQRVLPRSGLEKSFQGRIRSIRVLETRGFFQTEITLPDRTLKLSYDELQRRLAPVFGWSALPSLPERVQEASKGFLFRGRGSGHRVGLCLSE